VDSSSRVTWQPKSRPPPPSVVLTNVPESPTAVPVLASTQETRTGIGRPGGLGPQGRSRCHMVPSRPRRPGQPRRRRPRESCSSR